MSALRTILLIALATAASGVPRAQVPQPAAEPGSVPESQSAPAQNAPSSNDANPPARTIRISAGVIAGLKLSGDAPVYPADAKAQGVQGAVVMHALIGADGRVQSLAVLSGSPMLQEAALNAVKTWVYRPYLLNGRPVVIDTTVTVNFQMETAPGGR